MFRIPNKIAHVAIWTMLFAMGTLVMYAWDYSYSHAANSATANFNMNIADVYPVIETHVLTISTAPVTPITDGSTVPWSSAERNLFLSGQIYDPNGETPQIRAILYRSDLGMGCTPPAFENCLPPTCNVYPTADPTRFYYSCGAPIKHYIDTTTESYYNGGPDYTSSNFIFRISAGRWIADPPEYVYYHYQEDDYDDTSNFEMGSGIGIDATPSSMHFGNLAVNAYSSELTTNVQSYSNVRIDVGVFGKNSQACPNNGGTIPYSAFHYGFVSGYPWASQNALGSSQGSHMDINLDKGITAVDSIYWILHFSNAVRASTNCQPIDAEFWAQKG